MGATASRRAGVVQATPRQGPAKVKTDACALYSNGAVEISPIPVPRFGVFVLEWPYLRGDHHTHPKRRMGLSVLQVVATQGGTVPPAPRRGASRACSPNKH